MRTVDCCGSLAARRARLPHRAADRPPDHGAAHTCPEPSPPEGITNPPIDDLLTAADSKYALVIYAAKRARQINAYYSQLGEGLLEYVGPLVETRHQEKPLSIALREINEGLLDRPSPTED